MIRLPKRLFYFFIFFNLCALSEPISAQEKFCGTPLPSDNQKQLLQQVKDNLKSSRGSDKIRYIPIKPIIVRKSDGSGGMSLSELNIALANVNVYFKDLKVEFYFSGSGVKYFDNSEYYDFNSAHEASLTQSNDVNNAINIYFSNTIFIDGFGESGGYAYYPGTQSYTNRIFLVNNTSGGYTMAHELGHYFGLLHTFERSNGQEFVTRGEQSNCDYAGDGICDTPADPHGLSGATIDGCTYTGTITDPLGETFSPHLDNLMSYYSQCANNFTPGQLEVMNAGVDLRLTQKEYRLIGEPATMPAPADLKIINQTAESIRLSWSSITSNETGYILERSVSSSENFTPIAGLAPNQTSFIDEKVFPGLVYYYRVKASNSIDNYSNIITFCPDISEAGSIAGASSTCVGSSTYSIDVLPGLSYEWTLSGGGKIINEGKTATVIWDTPGTHNLIVTPYNSCKRGVSKNLTVMVNTLPEEPELLKGLTEVCLGQYEYIIESPGKLEYTWEVSDENYISFEGNKAKVTWIKPGLQTLSVFGTNSCGEGQVKSLQINVLDDIVPNITGSVLTDQTTVCPGLQSFQAPNIPGISYTWSITPESGTIVSEGANASVNWTKEGNHKVIVTPSNSCGKGQSIFLDILVKSLPPKPEISLQEGKLISSMEGDHQWYFNGMVIIGATGKICPATIAGVYTVQAVNSCGVGLLSEDYILEESIPHSVDEKMIDIFPNPATNLVNIDLPSDVDLENVSFISTRGEILYLDEDFVQKQITIRGNMFMQRLSFDVNHLARGIYLLQVQTGNSVIHRKIILN